MPTSTHSARASNRGMTVKEIKTVIDDPQEAPDTVTACVIWSPPVTGRATAVLRVMSGTDAFCE